MRGLMIDIFRGDKCFPWPGACLFSGSIGELSMLIKGIRWRVKNYEACPDCGGDIATGELTDCTKNGGGYFPLTCVVCGKEIDEK